MKKKINIILTIMILSIFISILVKYIFNKDLNNQRKELEKTILKYGYVEKESVSKSIKKLNKEVN